MKFIAASCSALLAISGSAMAQNAHGCYPSLVVGDMNTFIKGGAPRSKAMALSLNENWDGSEGCKYRINAEFIERGLPAPFR